MSYIEALQAAGAVIHDERSFGSYQGEAVFDLTYQGTRGFVIIVYGSCSGCDAFESSFGYADEKCDEHTYDSNGPADCEACQKQVSSYQAKLAAFGADYLDDGQVLDVQKAKDSFADQLEWDRDAADIIRYIEERAKEQA